MGKKNKAYCFECRRDLKADEVNEHHNMHKRLKTNTTIFYKTGGFIKYDFENEGV